MAALSLSNINTSVGHNCGKWDSTFLSTFVQPKVLERAEFLAHLDEFQELKANTTFTLTAGTQSYTLSALGSDAYIAHYGIPIGVGITTAGSERTLNKIEYEIFKQLYPVADATGCPQTYALYDHTIYFQQTPDLAYTGYILYLMIYQDFDALSSAFSSLLPEMAKIYLIEMASYDVLKGILNRPNEAMIHKQDADEKLAAYENKRRLTNERNSGFISLRGFWQAGRKNTNILGW